MFSNIITIIAIVLYIVFKFAIKGTKGSNEVTYDEPSKTLDDTQNYNQDITISQSDGVEEQPSQEKKKGFIDIFIDEMEDEESDKDLFEILLESAKGQKRVEPLAEDVKPAVEPYQEESKGGEYKYEEPQNVEQPVVERVEYKPIVIEEHLEENIEQEEEKSGVENSDKKKFDLQVMGKDMIVYNAILTPKFKEY